MVMVASCPACGAHLSELGRTSSRTHPLRCAGKGCPRPLAALELLSEKQGTDHVVVIERNGFSVKHPLIERLDDKLLHCPLAEHVAEFGQEWLWNPETESGDLDPGVAYRMWGVTGHTPDTPNGPEQWDYHVEWPVDDEGNPIPFDQEKP